MPGRERLAALEPGDIWGQREKSGGPASPLDLAASTE